MERAAGLGVRVVVLMQAQWLVGQVEATSADDHNTQ